MKKNVMFNIMYEVLEIPSRYDYLEYKSLLWYSFSEIIQFQREYNLEIMYQFLHEQK